MMRIRSQPGTDQLMEAVATFAPPEPGPGAPGAPYAYARALVWSMARVAAAVATIEGVMRQVTEVRVNYGAGVIEIRAVVLVDQTPEQVQRDLLDAVAAVPAEAVNAAVALFLKEPTS